MQTLTHSQVVLAGGLFLLAYALIVTERVHRTVAALGAGTLAVAMGVVSQSRALDYVDWGTLSLLVGMMVMVRVLARTGLFEALAYHTVRAAGGRPLRLLVGLSVLTAVVSALLDNVTTILVIAPVTLAVAEMLGVDPLPFAMAEVFAANIGGTATLIGDPPNIMIGGAAHLDFNAFLANLAPVAALALVMTLALIVVRHRRTFAGVSTSDVAIKPPEVHPHLTPRSVAVFAATILGLALHPFGLQPGLVAVLGAAMGLVLLPHEQVEAVLRELEWGTVFFFAGLYLLVGGLVESGAVGDLARAAISVAGGQSKLLLDAVLWASALASSLVDNVPWAAAMIPLIQRLDGLGAGNAKPLWWALALGTCLGGNGTLVGASANLVMSSVLAKRGRRLSFWAFTKEAFPLMLVSVAISAAYLHWRYGP